MPKLPTIMAEGLPRHIVDIRDFSRGLLIDVFAETSNMERVANAGGSDQLRNRLYYLLFYGPSHLTSDSFIRAIGFLGGKWREREVPNQSLWKGGIENLAETVTDLKYDGLILRGYQVGDTKKAASVSEKPVISAGDALNNQYLDIIQHPTHAIGDLRTIYERQRGFRGLRVVFAGDVRSHSGVNSLLMALSVFEGVDITVASPSVGGGLEKSLEDWLGEKKIPIHRLYDNSTTWQAMKKADVVYLAQSDSSDREEHLVRSNHPDTVRVDSESLGYLSPNAMILHDMVRGEKPATASHPLAVWRRQRENHLYTKMALLSMLDSQSGPNL